MPIEWLIPASRSSSGLAACGACWLGLTAGPAMPPTSLATSASRTALAASLAEFAERYGDQTERDHAELAKAIKNGRVKAAAVDDDA